jgi:signal transduction histidine kinase
MLARVGAEDAVSVFVQTDGQPTAALPPDALKQVLLNLVQNAREAVPTGLVVRIDVHSDGASTAITVCDNGPGVPPAIRGRIFDPFFTTRGSAGGIGLGLFVVEGVVRGCGGRVWLTEAESGGGACFHVALPSGTVESDAYAAQPAVSKEVRT